MKSTKICVVSRKDLSPNNKDTADEILTFLQQILLQLFRRHSSKNGQNFKYIKRP